MVLSSYTELFFFVHYNVYMQVTVADPGFSEREAQSFLESVDCFNAPLHILSESRE